MPDDASDDAGNDGYDSVPALVSDDSARMINRGAAKQHATSTRTKRPRKAAYNEMERFVRFRDANSHWVNREQYTGAEKRAALEICVIRDSLDSLDALHSLDSWD